MAQKAAPAPERRSGENELQQEILSFAQECLRQITDFQSTQVTPTSIIGEEIELKSIELVEFQVALEDEFNVQLDPLEILECGSLIQVASYILTEMRAGNLRSNVTAATGS